MNAMHARIISCGLIGCVACGTAESVEPFGATPQENALCSALVFEGKDKAYHSRLEPDAGWGHTHHWCDCVRFRHRALKAIGNKAAVTHNLNEAIGGCDYVISHVSPGSRILPKVHVDKGRALKLRGDDGAATLEFQRALALNPREVNAYSELSLLQEARGQKSAARETATLGLRHNPDSKLLQKRYLELGGKEPFPEPIASIVPEPAKKLTEQPSQEKLPDLAPPASLNAVNARTEAPVESEAAEQGKPGEDRSGRSCRFCSPDEIQQRWINSFKASREKKTE